MEIMEIMNLWSVAKHLCSSSTFDAIALNRLPFRRHAIMYTAKSTRFNIGSYFFLKSSLKEGQRLDGLAGRCSVCPRQQWIRWILVWEVERTHDWITNPTSVVGKSETCVTQTVLETDSQSKKGQYPFCLAGIQSSLCGLNGFGVVHSASLPLACAAASRFQVCTSFRILLCCSAESPKNTNYRTPCCSAGWSGLFSAVALSTCMAKFNFLTSTPVLAWEITLTGPSAMMTCQPKGSGREIRGRQEGRSALHHSP